MRRLLIWIPVYGLVAIVLPRQPVFERLVEPLLRIPPDLVMMIVVPTLFLSAALMYLMRREPNGWMFRYPTWYMPILFAGLVGLAFSSALDMLDFFTGGGPNVIFLILIPLAFMAAEAMVLAVEHRLDKGPLGSSGGEPRGYETHDLDEELARARSGKGTSFMGERRARDFLDYAGEKGIVVTTLEVWAIDGDNARLRPDLSVAPDAVKNLPADMTRDLINARLSKALGGEDEHVFVMGI
ncbi:MAG: hypothetical protein AAFQ18_05585 [Pseudomonadota bacterium]